MNVLLESVHVIYLSSFNSAVHGISRTMCWLFGSVDRALLSVNGLVLAMRRRPWNERTDAIVDVYGMLLYRRRENMRANGFILTFLDVDEMELRQGSEADPSRSGHSCHFTSPSLSPTHIHQHSINLDK